MESFNAVNYGEGETTFPAPCQVSEEELQRREGLQPLYTSYADISVDVPIGGSVTLDDADLLPALAVNSPDVQHTGNSKDLFVHPTKYEIVGEESTNPTGVKVGVNINNTKKVHKHKSQTKSTDFSVILGDRYHPVISRTVDADKGPEELHDIEKHVSKWKNVDKEQLLAGVQPLKHKNQKMPYAYIGPVGLPSGVTHEEQGAEYVDPQAMVHYVEKNRNNPAWEGQIRQTEINDGTAVVPALEMSSQVVDDAITQIHKLKSNRGVLQKNISGHLVDDVNKLSDIPEGSRTVTIGMRVHAMVLRK